MRARLSIFRSRRGSVIVVLLVTLLFASLLLTRLLEASSTDLLIAMRQADKERLRADAYSAMETVFAVLADFRTIDRGLYAPSQGWSDPMGYAAYTPREGVTIDVAFEDESGKLSLPAIRPDQMSALLLQLGLLQADATRVSDALFVWMRNGHTSGDATLSAASYEQADPAAQPPYRSLRSWDELQSINVARDFFYDADGHPTQLWQDFTHAVSLYQFGSTNLNTASSTVLLAAGWNQSQIDTSQKYLTTQQATNKTVPFYRSTQEVQREVGKVSVSGFGTQVTCLRVIVTARQGAAYLQLSALITPGNQARLPATSTTSASNSPRGAQAQNNSAQQATVSRPTASSSAQPRTSGSNGNTTTNSLRYPFTVLELSENTLPPPVSPST